jgi:hypothetical protein
MSSRRIVHDEIVRLIKLSDPILASCVEEAIKSYDNNSELYAYLLPYKYGEMIINSEGLKLPEKTSADLRRDIVNDISKASSNIPFGVILENNAEVFLTNELNISKSLVILRAGELLGSYEAVDFMESLSYTKPPLRYRPPWQVVAGARSIFLPALFNSAQVRSNLDNFLITNGLHDLEYYKRISPPFEEDIFPFVRDVANAKLFGMDDWKTTVIIFPDKWLETVSAKVNNFHHYIYNSAWKQSANFRNREALLSKLSKYLNPYQGTQTYDVTSKIVLNLFEIGLEHQPAHQVIQEGSPQTNGPFLEVIKLLQAKLNMSQQSLLMLEPAYIQSDSKEMPNKEYFYSATSLGKPLSNFGRGQQSPYNLSNLFFSPLSKVLRNQTFLEDVDSICEKKLSFQLYGKKRDKFNVLDIRDVFNVSNERQQNINYNHAFLLACIKIAANE